MAPARSASISVLDHGLTVGDGAFETMKLVRGVPFAVTRHLDRLAASARGLGLTPPAADGVRDAIAAVIDANRLGGVTGAVVRVTYTAGIGPLGSGRLEGSAPTLIVACAPAREWAPVSRVWVVPWTRNERGAVAGLKTTSYAENVVALEYAHERGADEAIFANTAGRLCEGTDGNVFVEHGGRMVTPPLAAGCLAGVTRGLLLSIGVAVEEDVPLEALRGAREAFVASTTRDVHPIAFVDDAALAAAPGPLTMAAAEAFSALVARDLDP